MKKTIALILTAVLVLSLCACGGGGGKDQALQVGFDRQSITPTETGAPIAGGDSSARPSDGFLDEVCVTCIALSKGGETYLVFTCDFMIIYDKVLDPVKLVISEDTGIPKENMLFNCTHTHSGPAVAYNYDSILPYRDKFNKAAVKAAESAIGDLSPAQIYGGTTDTETLIFVRHYEMDNGTFAGANYGSFSGSIKGHAYEGDTHVQVIRFVREAEDKKDIVLISNPAHATAVSGTDRDLLSADIAFSTRDHVEKNADVHVAYFIGAAGDQIPSSRIPEEGSTADYLEYGKRMGQYVVDLLPQLQPYDSGAPQLKTQSYTGNTIKEGLDRLEDAKQVRAVASQYGNSAPETKAAVAQYGFSSVYQASAIVARSSRGETQTMTLNAMSLGGISFVFAPYEMFSENGVFIKENSPFGMTFIITCSENHQGYLPSVNGFRVDCYESHVTVYARGTAEDLADTYVAMLKELKGE